LSGIASRTMMTRLEAELLREPVQGGRAPFAAAARLEPDRHEGFLEHRAEARLGRRGRLAPCRPAAARRAPEAQSKGHLRLYRPFRPFRAQPPRRTPRTPFRQTPPAFSHERFVLALLMPMMMIGINPPLKIF